MFVDREEVAHLKRRIILANVMDEDEDGLVRHNSERLAGVLIRWYGRAQKAYRDV